MDGMSNYPPGGREFLPNRTLDIDYEQEKYDPEYENDPEDEYENDPEYENYSGDKYIAISNYFLTGG